MQVWGRFGWANKQTTTTRTPVPSYYSIHLALSRKSNNDIYWWNFDFMHPRRMCCCPMEENMTTKGRRWCQSSVGNIIIITWPRCCRSPRTMTLTKRLLWGCNLTHKSRKMWKDVIASLPFDRRWVGRVEEEENGWQVNTNNNSNINACRC